MYVCFLEKGTVWLRGGWAACDVGSCKVTTCFPIKTEEIGT